MTTHPEFPDLQGWQACLALAEARLARPDLQFDVRQSLLLEEPDDFDNATSAILHPVELDVRACGLAVEVLFEGHDLVKLRLQLNGFMTVGGNHVVKLKNVPWEIITALRVEGGDTAHRVRADLADPRRTERAGPVAGDPAAQVQLTLALRRWAGLHVQDHALTLFAFDTKAARDVGTPITKFGVNSSFARVASVRSSLLLLMGTASSAGATAPVIDPHVLPQGETAVLWVDRATLSRVLTPAVWRGSPFAEAVARKFGQLLPTHLTDTGDTWAHAVIEHVSVAEPLAYTNVHVGDTMVKFSATPLSLAELDAMTPDDLAVCKEGLVRQKTNQLFSDCVLYHLDDDVRGRLLNLPKPTIAPEVEALARPHADWLRDLGRLQVVLMAKRSAKGDMRPYSRLELEAVRRKRRSLCGTDRCRDLTNKLYPLAFCMARPRLALYREKAAVWLPRYLEHLSGEAYVERLLVLDDPVSQLHDDAAKLSLLDAEGSRTAAFVEQASVLLLKKLAERDWKTVVATKPEEFRHAFELVLEGLRDKHAAAPADWLAGAGTSRDVAEHWCALLATGTAETAANTLKEHAKALGEAMRGIGARALESLAYAAEAAVIATLLAPTQALAADSSVGNLQPFIDGIAATFIHTLPEGPIAANWMVTATGAVLATAKATRWVAQTAKKSAEAAAEFFKTPAGRSFARAGAVLSLLSLGYAVFEFIQDIKSNRVVDAVVDGVSAVLAAISTYLFLASPESGLLGAALFVAGLVIGIFKYIWDALHPNMQPNVDEALVKAVEAILPKDGVAAAGT